MLAIGGRAPEFTLPDQDDQNVSLSTLLRHGPLILYFYPADFTPGCTKEACSIRDLHTEIQQVGLDVAGVSPQSAATHRSASSTVPSSMVAARSRWQTTSSVRARGRRMRRARIWLARLIGRRIVMRACPAARRGILPK